MNRDEFKVRIKTLEEVERVGLAHNEDFFKRLGNSVCRARYKRGKKSIEVYLGYPDANKDNKWYTIGTWSYEIIDGNKLFEF